MANTEPQKLYIHKNQAKFSFKNKYIIDCKNCLQALAVL